MDFKLDLSTSTIRYTQVVNESLLKLYFFDRFGASQGIASRGVDLVVRLLGPVGRASPAFRIVPNRSEAPRRSSSSRIFWSDSPRF